MSYLRSVLILLALIVACPALAGCGQKGPLYLPSEQPPESQQDGVQ